MTKIYTGKIPFYKAREWDSETKSTFVSTTWTQASYEDYNLRSDGVWLDNSLFFARLKFEGMSRGRSAANFSAKLSKVECSGNKELEKVLEGAEVNIFMTDLLHIITNINIYGGKTGDGLWSFIKRGSNYGIKLESPA